MNSNSARRLLAALLLRAARDAQADDDPYLSAEARRWLADEGAVWAEELDLDGERVTAWVDGLEMLPYEQLRLGL